MAVERRLADGWTEVVREGEFAVIKSERSGFMRLVAVASPGEYRRLDGPAIRPGPSEGDELSFARRMLEGKT